VIIIIVVIVVLGAAVAAAVWYKFYGPGKPEAVETEITAVDGNAKVGDVEADGKFSAVPLDSARTDASGDVKVEVAVGVKANAN